MGGLSFFGARADVKTKLSPSGLRWLSERPNSAVTTLPEYPTSSLVVAR
jgi:hypothetical protein